MAKGYTTVGDIQSHLGRTLTSDQTTRAESLIGAAEALIDRETRKAWLAPTITAERHDIIRPRIYLIHHPVSSIQAIHVRTVAVGDPGATLVAGSDYELLDANLGEVRFADGFGIPTDYGASYDVDQASSEREYEDALIFGDMIAFVSYTPTGPPVPADITLCATEIVARTLYLSLFPDRYGLDQLKVDSETTLQYASAGEMIVVSPLARAIIDGYRLPIIS